MYDRILVPTDGSKRAERAASHALSIAQRYDASVHLLHVIDTTLVDVRALAPEYQEAMTDRGNRAMNRIKEVAKNLDIATQRTIMQGRPHEGILTYIEDNAIDIVVMGKRGLTGLNRLLLGSVTEKVVRRASCPVITTRGEADLSTDVVAECAYDRILVPTDGSENVMIAIENALSLADAYDAILHALYVSDERAYMTHSGQKNIWETVEERLRKRGEQATNAVVERATPMDISVTEAIETGIPARTIQAYVEENDIDLITLGTTGQGGLQRRVLGSVTDRVVRLSIVPVLTARGGSVD